MARTMRTDSGFIEAAIKKAVEDRTKELLDEAITKAQQEIREELCKEVDSLALLVLKRYHVESFKEEIVIRVSKEIT